jgi:hypothetical protein
MKKHLFNYRDERRAWQQLSWLLERVLPESAAAELQPVWFQFILSRKTLV